VGRHRVDRWQCACGPSTAEDTIQCEFQRVQFFIIKGLVGLGFTRLTFFKFSALSPHMMVSLKNVDKGQR
jgi:hypothetical protein